MPTPEQLMAKYNAQLQSFQRRNVASPAYFWDGWVSPGYGRVKDASGNSLVAPVQGNAATAIGSPVLYIPGQPQGLIKLQEVINPVEPVTIVEPGFGWVTVYFKPYPGTNQDVWWIQGSAIEEQPITTPDDPKIVYTPHFYAEKGVLRIYLVLRMDDAGPFSIVDQVYQGVEAFNLDLPLFYYKSSLDAEWEASKATTVETTRRLRDIAIESYPDVVAFPGRILYLDLMQFHNAYTTTFDTIVNTSGDRIILEIYYGFDDETDNEYDIFVFYLVYDGVDEINIGWEATIQEYMIVPGEFGVDGEPERSELFFYPANAKDLANTFIPNISYPENFQLNNGDKVLGHNKPGLYGDGTYPLYGKTLLAANRKEAYFEWEYNLSNDFANDRLNQIQALGNWDGLKDGNFERQYAGIDQGNDDGSMFVYGILKTNLETGDSELKEFLEIRSGKLDRDLFNRYYGTLRKFRGFNLDENVNPLDVNPLLIRESEDEINDKIKWISRIQVFDETAYYYDVNRNKIVSCPLGVANDTSYFNPDNREFHSTSIPKDFPGITDYYYSYIFRADDWGHPEDDPNFFIYENWRVNIEKIVLEEQPGPLKETDRNGYTIVYPL